MSLGLVGSHRVGKTSLAEAVSNEAGFPLVLTTTSEVCKKMGVDPSMPMSFTQRIDLQNRILDAGEEVWSKESEHFVTDRTPVDMLMYTLADITGDVARSDTEYEQLKRYSDRCIQATERHFTTLVLIQPGIPLVEDSSKATAAMNRSYMQHLNTLAKGVMNAEELKSKSFVLDKSIIDMSKRVGAVLGCVDRTYDKIMAGAGFIH